MPVRAMFRSGQTTTSAKPNPGLAREFIRNACAPETSTTAGDPNNGCGACHPLVSIERRHRNRPRQSAEHRTNASTHHYG